MSSASEWQCSLHNSKDRDNALFLNERLSDLTIIFPLQNISLPAHRLMMAKTSPYFENLLYGPMSIQDQEWIVKDKDVDPEVFKVVLAHCYEVNLLDESLEKTLQVYKLADCYMIDSLKSQCLENIKEPMTWADMENGLELSTNFGFLDIEDKIFEMFSTRLDITKGDYIIDKHFFNIYAKLSDLLLNRPIDKHKELLCRFKYLHVFIFNESWHHHKQLSDKVLISIFESSCCKNNCEKNLSLLKGCISPKTIAHFINMKMLSHSINMKRLSHKKNSDILELHAYISLIDVTHSQELYECLKNYLHDEDDLLLHMYLQVPCNDISPEILTIWSSFEIALYLSYANDQSVPLIVSSILSQKLNMLFLTKCSLSLNGFKNLVTNLKFSDFEFDINICSPNIKKEYQEELNALTSHCICIYESDEDMQGILFQFVE